MVDKVELINEINKVLEASVQMRLCLQKHNVLKVGVIDVRVYPEQSFENYLDNTHKVFWEGHTQLAGEYFFIIELVFNPSH